MELLEGFSLQALVDRFGPVPPERAVRLLRQACHSLAEAHAAGLVHRDVKPANLFVCRLGLDLDFVKVLDFGLVKVQHADATGAEALTGEGGFTGTPGYMAPEVAVGAEVDQRADIYALGCVAYWLLTGRRVFESGSAMQIVVDHVRTPPVPPSQRAGQAIPPGLERSSCAAWRRIRPAAPRARPSSPASWTRSASKPCGRMRARETGGTSTRPFERRTRPRRRRWQHRRDPLPWPGARAPPEALRSSRTRRGGRWLIQ